MNRRKFLTVSGISALSSVMIVPRHVLGGKGYIPPSDKLNIGAIGVGGRGSDDLKGVDGENIIALCDVDQNRAKRSFAKYPNAKQYADFRIMLDKEKGIDAVVIATPDHVHAAASMMAIKMGKHVYCEKPLTHTVYEARALAKAAAEARVATQMGNQGMAHDANRTLKEWLWDGAIGPVREVHAWSDRPTRFGTTKLWWPQGVERPTDTPPVPETLNWDLWLGPAPYRSYHPAYAPFVWRGWYDFGTGAMGDLAIHNLAPVFSSLKLKAPVRINASSTPVFSESYPIASLIHFEFPARENMPPVTVHWYDGGLLPARPEEFEGDQALPRENGVIFVGEKGKILLEGEGGSSLRFIPESKINDYKQPAQTLPRSIGHHKEWIEACKGNGHTESNFGFSGLLTETCLLGNIAVRMGGKLLQWDTENFKIANNDDANQYLHFKYRDGWSL